MALNKATLKNDIIGFMSSNASSANEFATKLFDKYESYASTASDPSQDTPNGFPSKTAAAAMLGSMMASMNVPGVTNVAAAQSLAGALDSALVLFWTGVTFKTAIPMAPMISEILSVVTVPGTPAQLLTPGLSTTYDNVNDAAGVWADAMDAFTKTVIVTITGLMTGPSGPVPAPPLIGPIT